MNRAGDGPPFGMRSARWVSRGTSQANSSISACVSRCHRGRRGSVETAPRSMRNARQRGPAVLILAAVELAGGQPPDEFQHWGDLTGWGTGEVYFAYNRGFDCGGRVRCARERCGRGKRSACRQDVLRRCVDHCRLEWHGDRRGTKRQRGGDRRLHRRQLEAIDLPGHQRHRPRQRIPAEHQLH